MRPPRALVVTLAVLAVAAAGCGADTVPESKLASLVLAESDLPAAFARFDYGPQQRLDNTGLRADAQRYGREGGWKARYRRGGTSKTRGPLVVESRADVFSKAGGAKTDLLAYEQQLGERPAARKLAPPQLGDHAVAVTQLQPGLQPVRTFVVAWRDRNVTASVTVNGFDGRISLADALTLARAQERRIARS